MTETSKARRELEVDAAVLAIAAGLIHAVVAVSHAREYWLFSALFALVAVGQIGWGVLVYRGAGPRLLAAGAIVTLGVVAVWVLSRTSGLPIGPEAGRPERLGLLDVLATVDELVTVAMVVGLLRFARLRASAIGLAARVGPVLGITLAMLSLVSLTLGVHSH